MLTAQAPAKVDTNAFGMRRSAFTLIETLVGLALLAMVGYVTAKLLMPVIIGSNRTLASLAASSPVEKAVSLIHAEAYQAGPKGISLASTPNSWTLAMVLRTTPSNGALALWEKQLRVYRYRAEPGTLSLQVYPDLSWPDGTPRLTGQEPLHFSAEELQSLPSGEERVLVGNLHTTGLWEKPESLWRAEYRPPDSPSSEVLLTLGDDW